MVCATHLPRCAAHPRTRPRLPRLLGTRYEEWADTGHIAFDGPLAVVTAVLVERRPWRRLVGRVEDEVDIGRAVRRSNLPQHAKVQAHVVVKLPAAVRRREAARHEEDAATDDLHAGIRGIAPVQARHVIERDRSRWVLVAQLRSAAVAARGGFGSLLTQAPRPTSGLLFLDDTSARLRLRCRQRGALLERQ